jgi:hypothetical protein
MEEIRFEFSMELRRRQSKRRRDAEEFPARHWKRARRSLGRRFQRTGAIRKRRIIDFKT